MNRFIGLFIPVSLFMGLALISVADNPKSQDDDKGQRLQVTEKTVNPKLRFVLDNLVNPKLRFVFLASKIDPKKLKIKDRQGLDNFFRSLQGIVVERNTNENTNDIFITTSECDPKNTKALLKAMRDKHPTLKKFLEGALMAHNILDHVDHEVRSYDVRSSSPELLKDVYGLIVDIAAAKKDVPLTVFVGTMPCVGPSMMASDGSCFSNFNTSMTYKDFKNKMIEYVKKLKQLMPQKKIESAGLEHSQQKGLAPAQAHSAVNVKAPSKDLSSPKTTKGSKMNALLKSS